jgi:hypothetical protein
MANAMLDQAMANTRAMLEPAFRFAGTPEQRAHFERHP